MKSRHNTENHLMEVKQSRLLFDNSYYAKYKQFLKKNIPWSLIRVLH